VIFLSVTFPVSNHVFRESRNRLNEIKEKDYDQLDKNSKSEYDGLAEMFDMLSAVDLKKM